MPKQPRPMARLPRTEKRRYHAPQMVPSMQALVEHTHEVKHHDAMPRMLETHSERRSQNPALQAVPRTNKNHQVHRRIGGMNALFLKTRID